MKVSAVIPAFNRRHYLPRAIDSILAQTVPVDEIVLVDDGSTDGSADFVHSRYGSRVRVVRQANTGVSGARHRGIHEACGEWIAFLDSDDEWLPERNAELLKAAKLVPQDVAWIFGDLRVVTDRGDGPTLYEEHGLTVSECPQVFADAACILHPFMFPMVQCSLIRRRVLLELDCFRQDLRSSEDLLAAYQVACRYRFAAIPRVVGRYFRTSDLAASSLMVSGVFNADYHLARMMAFGWMIESGRRRPWNSRYASEVRGLCRIRAREGKEVRDLAMQQFRYGGMSLKGLAFFLVALLGGRGLRFWDRVAQFRREHVARGAETGAVKPNGLQAYIQSVYNKPE